VIDEAPPGGARTLTEVWTPFGACSLKSVKAVAPAACFTVGFTTGAGFATGSCGVGCCGTALRPSGFAGSLGPPPNEIDDRPPGGLLVLTLERSCTMSTLILVDIVKGEGFENKL